MEVLSTDFLDFFFVLFMKVFHFFDILTNGNFFAVDSILMRLVEISLLSELFPSGFGLFGNHIGLLKLYLHLVNLGA